MLGVKNPRLFPIICKTDSAALHSAVHSNTQILDKRLRIETAILREMLGRKEIASISWVPTTEQLADALTKAGVPSWKILQNSPNWSFWCLHHIYSVNILLLFFCYNWCYCLIWFDSSLYSSQKKEGELLTYSLSISDGISLEPGGALIYMYCLSSWRLENDEMTWLIEVPREDLWKSAYWKIKNRRARREEKEDCYVQQTLVIVAAGPRLDT